MPFGRDSNPFLRDEGSSGLSVFWNIVQGIIIAIAINVTIYFMFVMPCQVDGPSMQPTLMNADLLLTNKIPTWLGQTTFGKENGLDYHRGDIIVFSYQDIYLVKRIIGIGGDTIMIKGGHVYLNGSLLNESYLASTIQTIYPDSMYALHNEGETFTIPGNQFFVLGDNRENSKDSRFAEVGLIDRGKIKGVVFFKFWPINQLKIISKPTYS